MTRHVRVPTRAEARAQLDQLYESLPYIECKGLCWDSCAAIEASELERERIAERGVELPPARSYSQVRAEIDADNTPVCPALGPLRNCRVYSVRPLICRVFGAVLDRSTGKGLMCEHGCVPDATIDPAELARVIRESNVSRSARPVCTGGCRSDRDRPRRLLRRRGPCRPHWGTGTRDRSQHRRWVAARTRYLDRTYGDL